jgi:hypothetical protein
MIDSGPRVTDRRGDARDRRRLAALAAAPAVVLALLGLAHPADLTTETAPAWTTLHVVLLPLFPLLGLPVLLLLRGERPPVIWGVGIALLIYAAFYTALDVLAGIATGTLVQRGADPEGGEVRALFDTGNGLSVHGVWAFVVAAAVTARERPHRVRALAVLAAGPRALIGLRHGCQGSDRAREGSGPHRRGVA